MGRDAQILSLMATGDPVAVDKIHTGLQMAADGWEAISSCGRAAETAPQTLFDENTKHNNTIQDL